MFWKITLTLTLTLTLFFLKMEFLLDSTTKCTPYKGAARHGTRQKQ